MFGARAGHVGPVHFVALRHRSTCQESACAIVCVEDADILLLPKLKETECLLPVAAKDVQPAVAVGESHTLM